MSGGMENRADQPSGVETIIGYGFFVAPIGSSHRLQTNEPAVVVAGELLDATSTLPAPTTDTTSAPTVEPAPTTNTAPTVEPAKRTRWHIPVLAGSAVVAAAAIAWLVVPDSTPSKVRTPPAAARIAPVPPAAKLIAPPVRPAPAEAKLPAKPVDAAEKAPVKPAEKSSVSVDHGSCSVKIDADIPGGVVVLDGRVIAATPVTLNGLYCGRRIHLTVAHPQLAPWNGTITPEEGRSQVVKASLRRLTTAVAVTSVPAGAMVRINGKEITTTPAAIPITVDVPTRVQITLPGYRTFERTIAPYAGSSAIIDATLEKMQ
jgi:hypothetical protein